MPLYRKLPKRGFKNHFATQYAIINLSDLDVFEAGAVIDLDTLVANGIIKKTFDGLKVLGNGEVTKAFTVKASKFSASAQEKIEAAGGKTEVV